MTFTRKRRIRDALSAALAAAVALTMIGVAGPTASAATGPAIKGFAHVQNIGDMRPAAANPLKLGTTGRSLRVEGMTLALVGAPAGSRITYRVHIQNVGWQGWRSNGAFAGSRGRSQRLEGFYAYLTGPIADQYTLQYRAHVQNIGWQGWRNGGKGSGSFAGTTGRSLRMEQLDFRLVKKPAPSITFGKAPVGGTAKVGSSLNVGAVTVTNSTTTSYMWLRDGTPTGVTSKTYQVKSADEGHKISLRVTAKNNVGSVSKTTGQVAIPVSVKVVGPISDRWKALGGASSFLGSPKANQFSVTGGVAQNFAGGRIYHSAATGARVVRGTILSKYDAAGSVAKLGLPTAEQANVTGGVKQTFEKATIFAATGGATHVVKGSILAKYNSSPTMANALGSAKSDEYSVTNGTAQDFVGGTVYALASGTFAVRGDIAAKYTAMGGQAVLGSPTGDEAGGVQPFEFATLTATPAGVVWKYAGPREIDTNSRVAVANAYNHWLVPATNEPVAWTGNTSKCAPGAPSAAAQAATFEAINFYRAMAGLSPVTESVEASSFAQAAALVFEANGYPGFTHSITPDLKCYSEKAATGARQSNISMGAVAGRMVSLFIADNGAGNEHVGHRRWLLKPETTTMGAGSTSLGGAVKVYGTGVASDATKIPTGVPYPSAGLFPHALVPQRWSYSANGVNFASATVTVTKGGASIGSTPVVSGNAVGYGWNTVVFTTPTLPKPAPGKVDTYHVKISGIPTVVEYDVKVVG